MKEWEKAMVNAAIMGGISFMSMVMAQLGQVTLQTFFAAILSAGITFLSLLCLYFRPPKTDINGDLVMESKSHTENKPGDRSSVKSGKILGLWVV